MSRINTFLREHGLTIDQNPCISPDFCLDWESLQHVLRSDEGITRHTPSQLRTADGDWMLWEAANGDHAWHYTPTFANAPLPLSGESLALGDGTYAFPATWKHLLELKNLILENDPASTIFPTANDQLGSRTLGVGARFTTLHWPGVDWAMAHLGIGLTANQNSIPRELVYDVEAMLDDKLAQIAFPFIGASVPEGHQGQSVEGMSHGCVLWKLKSGFHHRGIAWSFNADHQPVGGSFDTREDALVRGCVLASYITFDLSPELAQTTVPESAAERAAYVQGKVEPALTAKVRQRVASVGLQLDEEAFNELLCRVWPAMRKMKIRDNKYRAERVRLFSTEPGRKYLRELSIDELPGLTTPETTAIMLALCEAMEMPVNFVAPAFGFQKNLPYPDNTALRALIEKQWKVCSAFGVSIGFHSGSGKSAENYAVMGDVTGGCLEIKTSGRYTYEMGRALSTSTDASDQALWQDWHRFTVELAVQGAFSEQSTERKMAREFVSATWSGGDAPDDLFASPEALGRHLRALPADPEHMFWFEYNFLYVLAAGGDAAKSSLGDHSPKGYAQRKRFYSISPEGRLAYARRVAEYLIFLAESTGLVPSNRCAEAKARLAGYADWDAFWQDIGPA